MCLVPENDAVRQTGLCEEHESGFFSNHVEELADKKEVMNVFEYEMKDKEEKTQKVRFQWVTSLEVTRRNLEEMILAGRGNNKCELP